MLEPLAMPWRKRLVPLAGLLLSACINLAPPFERPALPVPERYPPRAEAEDQGSAPATLCWQGFLREPDLVRLVEQALIHNLDLKAAALRVSEAQAAFGIQRAERFPSLALGVDLSRSRTPADLSVTGRPNLASREQIGVSLASWELDFWGRVANLESAALASYLATDAARQAFRLTLINQVIQGYLALGELDERLALARRSEASRADSLRIFRRRVELGATSRLELTQVEILWQQAHTLVAQLEQARAVQAQALGLLAGGDAAHLPAARVDPAVFSGVALRVGLPSELLMARPDVMAAEHRLRAAGASIGAARAAFFPRIALTASAGTASAELDGLFKGGSSVWSFSPGISLPLLDGGRREAALELARVRQAQGVVEYQKTLQGAFREVADGLAAIQWLTVQLATLNGSLAVQTERTRLARLRYESGAARYLEVLDAERDRLAVEQQHVQVRRALLSARVTLYVALGGGSLHEVPAACGALPCDPCPLKSPGKDHEAHRP
ncbi:efflux transporter outer membrane subunit [Zoogloea sp.]|uniref:efflux transporter outer membrane subunit n=1 Tax=Zoogloea sp. TaxID=49181 RepID=UPI00260415C4|nr:efflux transporter outer membrane subunit [Zoogloea sp.]MDD3352834.1 efflux transporter outer membrane subunit [Zoogloea sp.]